MNSGQMINQKGVSLIIVVFAMMLFAVLGWTLAVMLSTDFEANLRNLDSERALGLAEAGAQWALRQLKDEFNCSNFNPNGSPPGLLHNLNFGQYRVSCTCTDNPPNCMGSPELIIESRGYVSSEANFRAQRQIKIVVNQGAFSRAGTVRNLFDWSQVHANSYIEGDLMAKNFNRNNIDPYNEAIDLNVPGDPDDTRIPTAPSEPSLPPIDMAYMQQRAQAYDPNNVKDYSATAEVSSGSSGEDLKLIGEGIFDSTMADEPEVVRIVGVDWSDQNWVVIKQYQAKNWVKVENWVEVGEEKVTNGTFTGSASGWTLGPGWTYDSGAVSHSSDGKDPLSQTLPITIGRKYKLTYSITAWTDGVRVTPSLGGQTGTPRNAVGTYTEIFTATTTDGLAFTPIKKERCTIDDVSVTEIEMVDMKNWIGKTVRVVKRFAGEHNNEKLWYIKGSDIVIDLRSNAANFNSTSLVAEGSAGIQSGIVVIGSKGLAMKTYVDTSAHETFPNLATESGNIISNDTPEGGNESQKSNNRSFDGLIYTKNGDIQFNYINGVAMIGNNIFLDGLVKLVYKGKYVDSNGFLEAVAGNNWQEE